jgi:hypothetical protein
MPKGNCTNRNHRRSNPPVRVCPNCGEVVNSSIAIKSCSDHDHGIKKRRGSAFCYDCGMRLMG